YEDTVFQSEGNDYATEVSLAYITLRYRVPYASPSVEFLLPHRTINFIYYMVNHPDLRLYNLSGIKYVVHPVGRGVAEESAEEMGIHEVDRTPFATIRENPGAYPRAFVVRNVVMAKPARKLHETYINGKLVRREMVMNEAVIFDRMLAQDTDLKAIAVIEEPLGEAPFARPIVGQRSPASAPQPASTAASAEIMRYEPQKVDVQVRTQSAGFLVLTDTWYPGWQATVNGSPAPIYRTDYLFRGVAVPAGDSIVRFEFRPLSFFLGLWISVLSFLASLIWAFRRWP
ncbi:MAG: YfhO family protein, partial [bacterium]